MNKELTYTEAYTELQSIAEQIEQGLITVDELSAKVKRAAELIRLCKEKLTSTEETVNKVLKELGNEGARERENE